MGWLRIDRRCRRVGRLVLDDGAVVVERCHLADRTLARLVGLLATPDLADDEGVLLTPCGAIHMVGMRRSISCAFLDADGMVLRVLDPLAPGRRVRVRGARSVVEANPGILGHLRPGARVRFDP